MTMEQFAWTALGLLGGSLFAMFGNLFYLGHKIDNLTSQLSGRMDTLNGRIDSVSAQLNSRIDGISAQLQAHLEEHRRI